MTTQEFSNTFDTLLNSFNTQAQFGEQASSREIVLDEYEKSVLLTQAQDIIVKSYFDGSLNQQGQGFDDSIRRQVDFSSLIKVVTLTPRTKEVLPKSIEYNEQVFPIIDRGDANGFVGDSDWRSAKDGSGEGGVFLRRGVVNLNDDGTSSIGAGEVLTTEWKELKATIGDVYHLGDMKYVFTSNGSWEDISTLAQTVFDKSHSFDNRSIIFDMPHIGNDEATTDVLFILNERVEVDDKNYVVVPINYKEYDREMSKPFAQPLKKQAWRLFQNLSTEFDVHSELILKEAICNKATDKNLIYKIRYVKRPRPIVLEDLPNNLDIDGVSEETSCELNPILHMDILNKAVELAITTRGVSQQPRDNRQV